MSKKKEIIHGTLFFSIATQLTQVITMVTSIIVRNLLGPVQMGIYATLQIVLQYASYTSVGTSQGIAREIPYYLGKNDVSSAENLKNITVSFQVTVAVISAAAVALYALFFHHQLPPLMFGGLLFVAALIVLQRVSGLLISLLRAYKQFETASRQMFFSALANLVFVAVCAYLWKFYGFLLALVLSLIFNILYIYRVYPIQFRFQLQLKQLAPIIAFGFPLMLLSVLEGIYKSIDKLFITKMLGFEMMGFYTVAILASNLMNQIPNSLGIVLIPHFQEKYGKRDSVEDLKVYVDHAAFGLSGFMLLLIGAGWVALPLFVQLTMPEYQSGIRGAQLLLLGSYFTAVTQPFGIAIVTLKKHLKLFPVTILTLFLAAVLNYIFIRNGFGLSGVAFATTLTMGIQFLAVLKISTKYLYPDKNYFKILWPHIAKFFLLAGFLILVETFVSFENPYLTLGVRLVLLLICMIPILFQLNKRYGILGHFFHSKDS